MKIKWHITGPEVRTEKRIAKVDIQVFTLTFLTRNIKAI